MKKIIFLSEQRTYRSRMAEVFAREIAPADTKVSSACLKLEDFPAPASASMRELGLELPPFTSNLENESELLSHDIVITLCSKARELCPILPGTPGVITWNLPSPPAESDSPTIGDFRTERDSIRAAVSDFFNLGYYDSVVSLKSNFSVVLNNLDEGILVHDLNRKILHFNRAAERITGLRASKILGRDCHEVFPHGFCGAKCSFCESPPQNFTSAAYPIEIKTKNGIRKIEMRVAPMLDESDQMAGVIASIRDVTRVRSLEEMIENTSQFSGIIGRSPAILEVFDIIRNVAKSDIPVLIEGETGTGKELVAEAIHREGKRAGKLFVPVNCAALPEGTIESELFGHVRGAFTGAIRDKKGRFELANGGTIFLDEVGDLAPSIQVKLLRFLQEKTIERVGGDVSITVDARVVSATNKNIRDLVKKNLFREDLYYRLCVMPIQIPPLRERADDIPLLAEHILRKLIDQYDRVSLAFAPETMASLCSYTWPGNVRQLQNAIQYAFVKCNSFEILPKHLPQEIFEQTARTIRRGPGRVPVLDLSKVQSALKEAGGNRARAARILGVGRATLYRFLESNSM